MNDRSSPSVMNPPPGGRAEPPPDRLPLDHEVHIEVDRRRGQLRLVIAIPALMMLFTLGYGLITLKILDGHMEAVEAAGAGEVARAILYDQLYVMLLFTALASISGLGLALAIIRPINALSALIQRILRGNMDVRAPRMAAAPELGDLSRSFNSMIEFLNESIQDRNRYLIEGIVTGVMTTDLEARVTALNSAGAKMLGLDGGEVVGRRIADLRDRLPSKYHPFWDYVERPAAGEGTRMPDLITLSTHGEKLSVLTAMSLMRDAKGEPAGLIFNFREWAEIRSLREQFSRTDQLAALGTFTMGLAHELRNPLASIKGMVQLMQSKPALPPDDRHCFDLIVRDINRMDRFVGELNEFSHTQAASGWTDVNEVLRAAARQSRGLAAQFGAKEVELVEECGPVPLIWVEPERLELAFVNIIRNAYEACAPGSRITLRSLRREEEGEEQVMVYIHNTGSSISYAHRAKIFDPFFTTKERGTGLGLAIAYQIVTQQNAALTVSSQANEVTFIARFRTAEHPRLLDSAAWIPRPHGDSPREAHLP